MLALMLGRQRSGSGALGSILDQHRALSFAGEVLHPDDLDNPVNFFRYLRGGQDQIEKYLTPSRRIWLVQDYFNFLAAAAAPRSPILDIKYQSLHHWNQGWQGLFHQPWLVWYVKHQNLPVIHLVRQNFVATYVSGCLAEMNQIWHTLNPSTVTRKSLVISISDLCAFLRDASRESAILSEWLADHHNLITLHYEKMFDAEGNLSDDVGAQLSAFLNITSFEIKTSVWIKQAPRMLSQSVENFTEVAAALRGTEFEWMTRNQ